MSTPGGTTQLLWPLCLAVAACGSTSRAPGIQPGPGTTTPAAKLEVSSALLVPVDEGALEPLVCWDAAQHKVRAGEGCLELVTPGTAVRFDDGSSSQVVRHSPSNAAACGVSQVAEVAGGEGQSFAVWPDNATLGIQRIADSAGHTPDEGEKQALEGLAHAAAPDAKQPVVILQALAMDLDGDGTPDRLYEVTQDSDNSTTTRFAYSALVFVSGTSGGYHVLESSPEKTWKLDSTLDIDHDGRRELWLTTEIYDLDKQTGSGNLIARITPGGEPKLDAIGEISCYR